MVGDQRVDMRLWDTGVHLYALPYYATVQTIRSRGDVLAKFVRATAKGWQYAFDNRAKAVDLLIKEFPNLDRADELAAADVMMSFVFNANTKANGWGAMDPQVWKDQIELYASLGQFSKRVPALGLVPDIVVAPASGGGLIAGVATAVKAKFPQAQIIVAEPKDYDDHGLSLRAGHREAHHAAGRTICDALMAAMPGELTFSINSKLLANGVIASDEEVGAAVAFAYRELKLVVEPGGAVGLAALLAGRIDARGKNVVIVLSGGNVDADLFARLVA